MQYDIDVLNQILIFSIFAISLNLLLGYAGQISVAHAAFGGVGGYTALYLSMHFGLAFWPALLAGVALAGICGVVVSFPALRMSAGYLILLTVAVTEIIVSVVSSVNALGGAYGLLGTRTIEMFGFTLDTPVLVLPLVAPVTFIVYMICRRFGESPYGRVLRAIRDDDVATRALGKNVLRYKVTIFGITSAMAGLAGGLLAYYNQLASPGEFNFDQSIAIFVMVIFGGMGNLFGSIVGAAVVELFAPVLQAIVRISPEQAGLVRLLVYGLALVVLMRLRPSGLVPEGATWAGVVARLRRRGPVTPAALVPALVPAFAEAADGPARSLDGNVAASSAVRNPAAGATVRPRSAGPPAHDGTDDVPLRVHGLTKRFGGITAVQDLEFELERGKITALVGPNGAGKTTVFNLLTGAIRPDAGRVVLNGRDITGSKPDRIAQLGLVRSFQDVRVFPRLSALQNVAVGVQGQRGEKAAELFFRPVAADRAERRTRERAMEWLDFVGLSDRSGVPVGALAFGEQKLVAIARVLATEAEVLLLDEPASGIDARWVDATLSLIERVRTRGHTVCIVEHSLHVVQRLADVAYFMELGTVTAKGRIEELLAQERLAEAYFGIV